MDVIRRIMLWSLIIIAAVACSETPETPTPVAQRAATTAATAVFASTTPMATTVPPQPTAETADRTGLAGTIAAPEFPPGLDWLNTNRPLPLAELRGKIVLLDFWTYGCINCMHVIPDLQRLEEKFADELVIIGVHSAKFTTESETENIRQIIQRYGLEHPVINDKEFLVWQQYGATAWPTFVLIDPQGNVLGYHAGEGIYDLFNQVLAGMVAQFDAEGLIDRTPLELNLEGDRVANSPLLFPGKVLADAQNGRLFIADSNHNRIVITDLDGVVQAVVGSGLAGMSDGNFLQAALRQPQGMALHGANTLYVADTGNHAIRRLNLASGTVETVAGTGLQGGVDLLEGPGLEVNLNSPWDVLVVDGIVYIAMAGQHQLWHYDPTTQIARVFAGSGREVHTLVLIDTAGHLTKRAADRPYAGRTVTLEPQIIAPGETQLLLNLELPAGYKLNDLAPFGVEWTASEGVTVAGGAVYQETAPIFPLEFTVTAVPGASSLIAELLIYYCEAQTESLCLLEQVQLIAPLQIGAGGEGEITLSYTISQ